MTTGRDSREQRDISARPNPIEWREEHISEGQDMDIIVGTKIDPETGEVLSGELATLHDMARAAADAFVLADRARLDLAELQARVDEAIAAQFPELKELTRHAANLKAEYQVQQQSLREAALSFWRSLPAGAGKTLLGGAVQIAEATRVVEYNAQSALDWCDECRPEWVIREADKKMIEKLARADVGMVPPEVMRLEVVAETRVKESALAELAAV